MWNPSGNRSAAGESGGNGACWMLRGSANSVVAAVRVSMLATIMVSVRAPVRSGPASLPSSRTFMRAGSTGPVGTAAAGPGAGAVGNTRSSRARWV